MTKIFEESSAVTIDALDAHLRDSGLVPYNVQPDCIRLRTEKGIAYRITLDTDRKFIRVATYIPLRRNSPIDQKHELARRLNEEVFLPVFTIDQDGDLAVSYALTYLHGLIGGNFVSIVHRFASLLEYIVDAFNADGLIDFGAPTTVPAVADAGSGPTSGELLH
ncbi:YbjN domain-containing protein [Paraburkholderia tagetis]|uniref:YbjN domain-containing protein n=1 Tax=Paraburkholderia tagetis TaxID=2913261 RepID=A0A9X1RR71_9BURK|nr:YbjN domain-containing protein [Paraburkholderia tagetis]MCG5073459.1 YbjN domain-containing protein [Paraburkholderia tagetis]